MPKFTAMAIDLLVLFLLGLAFVAGFQRGVLPVFSLVLASLISLLILVWILPYYTDFFFASLSKSYHKYFEFGTVFLFILLAVTNFALLRLLWKNQSTGRNLRLQKMLGGLIMVVLMIGTILTLTGFLQQANLVQKAHLKDSKSMTFLSPIKTWGSTIYLQLNAAREQVKNGSLPANQ